MLVDRMERASFLHKLECVTPGLSAYGGVAQSGSYIFRGGGVLTYNEEVCCRAKSGLPKDFTGAVQAKSLTELLRKLKDDFVALDVEGGKFVVHGIDHSGKPVGRRARLHMDSEITIPLEGLEKPDSEKWEPVHEEFNEAVGIVQNVAGSDASQFAGTCVHVTPKWLEATDGFQVCRYRLQTGVKEAVLVKRDALKHVTTLDVTRIQETRGWLHFKNPSGVVLSVKRHLEDYPDLKPFLQVEGTPAALPKGLADAVQIASIFSKENADSNLLQVSLKPENGKGKNLVVTGVGVSGEYSEAARVQYDGPPMAFTVPPEVLSEIVRKHSECEVTPTRLIVQGGKWRYITTLGRPEEVQPPPRKDKSDGTEEARTMDEAASEESQAADEE